MMGGEQLLRVAGKQIEPYFLRAVGLAWSPHPQIKLFGADIHRADLFTNLKNRVIRAFVYIDYFQHFCSKSWIFLYFPYQTLT